MQCLQKVGVTDDADADLKGSILPIVSRLIIKVFRFSFSKSNVSVIGQKDPGISR